MKEELRKCLKCGSSPANDPETKLFRFPKPGSRNSYRSMLWAKYACPDQPWREISFQLKLYTAHKMLCHRHFKESEFADLRLKKLMRFARPDVEEETMHFPEDQGAKDPNIENNTLPDLAACESNASSADDDVPEPSPPPPPLLDLHTAQMCRVCLALDVKMFHLKDAELEIMFHSITGIEFEDNEGSTLGSLICWECAARLRAASTFRSKALLSDTLLQRLISKGEQIEKDYFETLKEEADHFVTPKTLTATEIIHIVDIEEENNVRQLVQSGYDDQHSISVNNDTHESMDENLQQIYVEGDKNVAVTTAIDNDPRPTCSNKIIDDEYPELMEISAVEETVDFSSDILLDTGDTALASEVTSSHRDCDDQIRNPFKKSGGKSKIVPRKYIEHKITNKRPKLSVTNEYAHYLKENSEDGNKKKELKTNGGTIKMESLLRLKRPSILKKRKYDFSHC